MAKKYVTNFKILNDTVHVRDAEALHTQDSDVLYSFATTDSLRKASNLVPGSVYSTSGYYDPEDGGGAMFLCEPLSESPCKRIHFDNVGAHTRLVMLYNNSVTLEQLGVHSGEPAVPGNGKLFNDALKLAMIRCNDLDPFTLHGHGKYIVDETLQFYCGDSSETKTWSGIFNTDFSGSVIETNKALQSLVSIRNMQENTLRFGQLSARSCASALEIVSNQRYDWSQYLTIYADWVAGREHAVYITNNKNGGWVNDIHFIGGVYESGFFVDCPNPKDILFKENLLNGFYFDHVSCEGSNASTPWFKFRNTWGVHITNTRTVDVAGLFMECLENCQQFSISLSRKIDHKLFKLSNDCHFINVTGILTWTNAFDMRNPSYDYGKWFSPTTQAIETVKASTPSLDFDPIFFYVGGAVGDIKLSKNYSNFTGITEIFCSLSGSASGRLVDGYGNQIINFTTHAGKYVVVRYVPGSGWVSQAFL